MARRSEFTQKLLDDIRLRKEKMGIVSPSIATAAHQTGDAYGSFVAPSRDSRSEIGDISQQQGSNGVANAAVAKMWLAATTGDRRGYMSASSQDPVHQLGIRRADQSIIDLPMAMALAQRNNGRQLRGVEVILHYGPTYRRGQSGGGHHAPGTPKSHADGPRQKFRVEASRGAQEADRIVLPAYGSEPRFGRDSIGSGRDLLKGAMELEESMKMLVSLQAASEQMLGSADRKRFSLLEGKEGKEEEPFSNRGRRDKEVRANTIASMNSNLHRRSMSFTLGAKPEYSSSGTNKRPGNEEDSMVSSEGDPNTAPERSKQPSGGDKVRIPNLVARLMGLDELPIPNSQAIESTVRKKPELLHSVVTGKLSGGSEGEPHTQHDYRTESSLRSVDTEGKAEEKREATNQVQSSLQVHSNYRNKQMDTESMKYLKQSSIEKAKENDAREENKKEREFQGNPRKQRNAQGLSLTKYQVPNAMKDNAALQQYEPNKLETDKADHSGKDVIQHHTRRGLHRNIERQSGQAFKSRKKYSGEMEAKLLCERARATDTENKISSPRVANNHQAKENSDTTHDAKIKTASSPLENQEVGGVTCADSKERISIEPDQGKFQPPIATPKVIKHEHITPAKKTSATKKMPNRKNRLLEEMPPQNPNLKYQNVKQQFEVLNNMKQIWKQKTRQVGKTTESQCNDLKKEEPPVSIFTSLPNDCRNETLVELAMDPGNDVHTPPYMSNDMKSALTTTEPSPHIQAKEEHEKHTPSLESNNLEGTMHHERCLEPMKTERQNACQKYGAIQYEENPLTRILYHNSYFLATAQELFNIHVGNVQATKEAMDKCNKLTLECVTEVMRRKSCKEEVMAMKLTVVPKKERSLASFITELNDDIESLKISSKRVAGGNTTADFLHITLEREIQNGNQDANCMWDFGWNSNSFADFEKNEVIKDLEKHVLSSLIKELAHDLLMHQLNTFLDGEKMLKAMRRVSYQTDEAESQPEPV